MRPFSKCRRLLISSLAGIAATLALAACDTPALVSSPLAPIGSEKLDKQFVGNWYLVRSHDSDNFGFQLFTLAVAEAEEGPHPGSFCLFVAGVDHAAPEEDSDTRSTVMEYMCYLGSLYQVKFEGETYMIARWTWLEAHLHEVLEDDIDGEAPQVSNTIRLDHHPYLIAKAEIRADGNLVVSPLMESEIESETSTDICNADCGMMEVISEKELASQVRNAKPGTMFKSQFVFARMPQEFPLQPDPEG